ncbi:hypothetical protein M9Y10_021596 [Tritrichomonas musculus]|uniref:RRM domain-containing protein n=1 Tax=Tritrichomonas musculus TaxID=1915356 RepID=A0ABR2KQZ7_9EUKA
MQAYSLSKIASTIENCISLQEISSNPRLVAILAYYGFLPLQELMANCKNITMTLEEAVQACLMSSTLSRFLILTPTPGLFVPYQVFPGTLILSNVPYKCTVEKLKIFISKIGGSEEFEIEKNMDESQIPTYTLKFKTIEMSTYLWRALKYIPFEDTFITVSPKIDLIKPLPPKNNQKYRNNRSNKYKNNRYNRYSHETKKKNSSSSDDSDNYNSKNNYHNSRVQRPALHIIKREEYMSKAPTIKIESPNNVNK